MEHNEGTPVPPESLLKRPLWVVFGQMGVVAAVFVGFGASGHMRPKVVIAILMCFVLGALALGPVRRATRIVVTAPVSIIVTWWLASYLWTSNVFGWWTDTQQHLPYVLACVVLVGVLPTASFRSALVAACYVTIAFTVLQIVLHPGVATVNPDGVPGWRGGFVHKNAMGPFMAFAVLTLACLDRRSTRRTIGVAVAGLLVVLAQSTTALGAGIVTLAVVGLLRRLAGSKRRARASIVALSAAGLMAGWIAYSAIIPALLGASGKDATLTGRTEIWSGVWRAINERPWTGYGIGGVWSDPSVDPGKRILDGLGFTVFHSHNGYLEVLLLLGAVGMALWAWLMVAVLRLGLRKLYADTSNALFLIGLVVLIAIMSITEVTMFGMWLALLCAFHCATVGDGLASRSVPTAADAERSPTAIATR